MSTDDTTGRGNGHVGRPGRLLPARQLNHLTEGIYPAPDRGTQLAGFATRQARWESAAPGAWPRFLLRHACWIVLVTIAAVAGAGLILHSQTRMYKSDVSVVVQPPGISTGANQATDMATEKGIVSSDVVLMAAAHALHILPSDLSSGLSVTSPGSTYLLTISYSSPDPYTAQRRAEAIAEAYVAYRTPTPASDGTASKPTATLITAASLPTSPFSPKAALDYCIAVVLGLSLGIGTAAIRDRLDDRLRGPADLEELTGAPLLAVIPAFWPIAGKAAGQLVMTSHPESLVADAYRGLRARIVQAAPTSRARLLVVTSPAREDTETVLANLATALAQSGRSTVLVCADLRWGRAHQLFGLEDAEGITGLLDRRTHLDKALIPSGIPGLQVLPAGRPPLDTGAMLERPAFRTLLGVLKDRADFVIVDGPAVLASADAQLLAELAEEILLVADARRSTRAQVRTATRELAPVQDKILGWVLTGVGRRCLLRRHRIPAPVGDGPPGAARPRTTAGAAATADTRDTAREMANDAPAHRDQDRAAGKADERLPAVPGPARDDDV